MAYEKHTWETGEVITAEKLNHIEDGIGGSDLIINASYVETSEDEGITVDSQLTVEGEGLSYNELVGMVNTGKKPTVVISILTKYWDDETDGIKEISVPDNMYIHSSNSNDEFLNCVFGHLNENFSLKKDGSFVCGSSGSGTYTYDATTKEYTFTVSE